MAGIAGAARSRPALPNQLDIEVLGFLLKQTTLVLIGTCELTLLNVC